MKNTRLNYFTRTCCIILVVATVLSCKTKNKTITTNPRTIQFINNDKKLLSDVIETSEQTNKIIFVDFHADWCLPCKILDEEVFNQREVFQFFNKNFINYKVDVEKNNGANLKLMYGAEELPTLLFLDSKGRIVTKYNGPVTQTKLMQMAKSALKK